MRLWIRRREKQKWRMSIKYSPITEMAMTK